MDITLVRKNAKTKQLSVTASTLEKLLNDVKIKKYEPYGALYRESLPNVKDPSEGRCYEQLYQVMASARFTRGKDGVLHFRSYNGVVKMVVDDLFEPQNITSVKSRAMVLPQTMAVMTGCDGHSVIILVRVTLPDGSVPQSEHDAQLFHIKAYRTAVRCYESELKWAIKIENPQIDGCFLMPFDEELVVNEHAVPFIIEQPTQNEVEQLIDIRNPSNLPAPTPANPRDFCSMTQVFNACYIRVRHSMNKEDWQQPLAAITSLAHECAETGLPEEETAWHLLWHFRTVSQLDVRSTVRAVYEGYEPLTLLRPGMPKKQVASIRLKEFLERRYELRRNVVTQMLEYRVRNSIDFRFHELTKYDKNTIKYEAAIEGIEAFDAEITGFMESNYTPTYNPIDEFIGNLGRWDGTSRIEALADLVPTQNPNWRVLFRRWFLSMVAHWMNIDQEHGNNTAPILIGRQGYRKSTFCRILLPPELRSFFTDSLDFRTKQEAERYLTRFLLINIDEFDQLSEQQFAFVKHLFQKPVVSMRRMYSENIAQMKRYASFIGTSNHHEILRDPTGNRRYLCVEVTAPIKTEVPINYEQLYAEAVTLIRQNERYWLDDADEALLRESNQAFDNQSPLEVVLLDMFRPETDGESDEQWLKVSEIMVELSHHKVYNRKTMNDLVKLGKVLRKAGFEARRKKDGMYYKMSRVRK